MKLIARERVLSLSIPRIMGILNITPDSFSDGGENQNIAAAIDHTVEMLAAGATIIDVGGESTRPGAKPISVEEELERVVPVIEMLAKRFDTFISVDTSKALVMQESIVAGAHMINDIHSLKDPKSLNVAATSQLPICLMHMQGNPSTMQKNPHYDNLIEEIKAYFVQQIARCKAAGIDKNRLLIDPGFGFGKTLEHNYQLLARLGNLRYLNLPILVGMSRKSMIGQVLNLPPKKRIIGSTSCAVIAALQGAKIIRVHDVKQTMEALRIVEATLLAKETYFQ